MKSAFFRSRVTLESSRDVRIIFAQSVLRLEKSFITRFQNFFPEISVRNNLEWEEKYKLIDQRFSLVYHERISFHVLRPVELKAATMTIRRGEPHTYKANNL